MPNIPLHSPDRPEHTAALTGVGLMRMRSENRLYDAAGQSRQHDHENQSSIQSVRLLPT